MNYYTELKVEVTPLELGRDILIAQLAEIDFESFVENEDGFLAYIISEKFNETKIKKLPLFEDSNFTISYQIKSIENQNWNKTWEENFEPINVENQCYIRAPFHTKKDYNFDIVIDPKMSFGTGHHETTYLMSKRILELDLLNKSVLDMGCGTAVLAILTEMKGAKYIEAIDIDEWAYNNSLENVRNNNCSNITVKHGGVEVMGENSFDVIYANINRNILLNDMKNYSNRLVNGGELLLSGFFKSDIDIITDEAKKNDLTVIYSELKNDWALLHLKKYA